MKLSRVVPVLGLPVSDVTLQETLDEMAAMIEAGQPDFIATANLDHAMRCRRDVRFREALCSARLVTADGMPLIWSSRLKTRGLRERVTGSDLLPQTCRMAAERGYRVFLLGGEEGIADRAAERLKTLYPALRLVGTHSPDFAPLERLNHAEMCDCVRRARPDVLFTSLGSPKGTLWLAQHLDALEVPLCLEVGAALTFAAGARHRSPRWVRSLGAEWTYRLIQEPRRLGGRYRANGVFLLRQLWSEAMNAKAGMPSRIEEEFELSSSTTLPVGQGQTCTAADRRRAPRGIHAESDTWRVTRQIAKRMTSQSTVRCELRAVDAGRANVLGALVWLYRHANRNGIALILHGLPSSISKQAEDLGGMRFARWIETGTPSSVLDAPRAMPLDRRDEDKFAAPLLPDPDPDSDSEDWTSDLSAGITAGPSSLSEKF